MGPNRVTLIFGVSGFIGPHLAHWLCRKGAKVVGTYHRHVPVPGSLDPRVQLLPCDVTQPLRVGRLVRRLRPGVIYFLSAQSSPRYSWLDPAGTLQTNLIGGVHLLEAVRRYAPRSRVLFFSSGTIYGCPQVKKGPFREEVCLAPEDPYGVSKAGLDTLARLYARVYGIRAMVVRLANLVGPGQTKAFSVANFASQLSGLLRRHPRSRIRLEVGNLSARRDFLDVRDAVRAIGWVIRWGRKGEVYNIGSGSSRALGAVLNQMIRLAGLGKRRVQLLERRTLMSKNEIQGISLDVSRIRRGSKWRPEIPFEQTLADILNDWRLRR